MSQENFTTPNWADRPIPKAPETPERIQATEQASDNAWKNQDASQQELQFAGDNRVREGFHGNYFPVRIHAGDAQGNQLPVTFRPEMPDQGPTVKR